MQFYLDGYLLLSFFTHFGEKNFTLLCIIVKFPNSEVLWFHITNRKIFTFLFFSGIMLEKSIFSNKYSKKKDEIPFRDIICFLFFFSVKEKKKKLLQNALITLHFITVVVTDTRWISQIWSLLIREYFFFFLEVFPQKTY